MTDERGRSDELILAGGSEESLGPEGHLRERVALLLGEKRYEEALELLYAARWQNPEAAEIPRGINLLKERLVRHYVEKLGNLDAVPSLAAGVDQVSLDIGDEERALLHLIDGISSFSDIAHQSRLGRFETYRGLSHIVGEGIVVVAPPPAATPLPVLHRPTPPAPRTAAVPPVPSPSSSLPRSPARRWRRPLIGIATLALTAATGVGWWVVERVSPSSHPSEAVAAGVPSDRRMPGDRAVGASARSSGAAAPGEEPTAEAPRAPALAATQPSPHEAVLAAADPAALRRSSRTAGKSGGHSKTHRSSRGSTPSEESAPAGAAAPTADAETVAVEEIEAPSLPELPEPPPPAAGRPTALQASFSDDRARPVPAGSPAPAAARPSRDVRPGLVKAAATSFAPATVSVAANDVAVRGSLGRSVIEHAIARALGDFRACYGTAAAASRRDAAGTARVSLTIDEAGFAGGVSVQGGPLPGLDGCLQEAAHRIRTRTPPDVGLATVSFAVVFSIGGPAR